MTATGYDPTQADIATGYIGTNLARPIDLTIPYSAGGLYSTVEDLYQWEQALYTDRLLTEASLTAMFTPYAPVSFSETLDYGYGWFVGEEFGLRTMNHGGGINGFAADIDRFPNQNGTVIILSNLEDAPIFPLLLGQLVKAVFPEAES